MGGAILPLPQYVYMAWCLVNLTVWVQIWLNHSTGNLADDSRINEASEPVTRCSVLLQAMSKQWNRFINTTLEIGSSFSAICSIAPTHVCNYWTQYFQLKYDDFE